MTRLPALPLLVVLVAGPVSAQAPGPLDRAAETITPAAIHSRIAILADDSMLGRDTPSAGLERAATYVVGEFRRLGLRPAGDRGTYVQRFGVRLLPHLYAYANPMPYDAARDMEIELAIALREQGYAVWQG